MSTKYLAIAAMLMTAQMTTLAFAETSHTDGHKSEHGGASYHAFIGELSAGDNRQAWDLDGWIGGDDHKLWLKFEGERFDNRTEKSELWALYSRNVSTFWDVQVGLRQDFEPSPTTYLTAGVSGLAPYFFETEAHLFVSDKGDISARLRQENDLLLTQKLIVQPFAELEFQAQDIAENHIGAGFSALEIGVQTRYEITRRFAPYIEVKYETRLGETASMARRLDEDRSETAVMAGIRVLF